MLPTNLDPKDESRCRRLVISHWDLREAIATAERLVALGPFGSRTGPEELERRARTLATVVAYARPFSNNRGAAVDRRLNVDEITLSPEQRELHGELLRLRDQVFAHSDAEEAEVSLSRNVHGDLVTTLVDPRPLMRLKHAERVLELAQQVSGWIDGELAKLGARWRAIDLSGPVDRGDW